MRDAWAGLRLAVGTLTMVPVGTLRPTTRPVAAWSMALAPVAALPLGVLVAAIAWLGAWISLPHLVTAALAIGGVAIGTRAMHLDGLADTADGIGAGWDRAQALAVMRSGDVGPMGVAALLVVVLVQVAATAALVPLSHGWLLVGTAVVVSRAATALGAVRGLPPAEGSRLGAAVVGTLPRAVAACVTLLCAAALASLAQVAGLPWWQGLAAMLALVLVVGWLLRTNLRVFGGVGGDALGAAIEVGLAAILVTLSAGGTA